MHVRNGDTVPSTTEFNEGIVNVNNIITDPIRVKTKGRKKEGNKAKQHTSSVPNESHRKIRRLCNELGHNRTCRKRNDSTSQPSSNFPQQNSDSPNAGVSPNSDS